MVIPEEYGLEIAKAVAEGAAKESVNKLSTVIGSIFPFWGLKREAITTYISEIQNSNLTPEAKMLSIANAKKTYKHMKNQQKIAQIAQEEAKDETNFSAQSKVDDEWLERFMDSAKFVSDEEMQLIWGKILAREFEEPNSTSPSVIRILSEVTPKYAKAFQVLCSLAVEFELSCDFNDDKDFISYVVLPSKHDYLNEYGLTFTTLNELQLLGLIQYEPNTGYKIDFTGDCKPNTIHLTYDNNHTSVANLPDGSLPIGCVRITDAGHSIENFITTEPIKEHFDAVIAFLKDMDIKFSDI